MSTVPALYVTLPEIQKEAMIYTTTIVKELSPSTIPARLPTPPTPRTKVRRGGRGRECIASTTELNCSKLTSYHLRPRLCSSLHTGSGLSVYGTVLGSAYSYPNCFACEAGYSGSPPSCTADPCVATSTSTDEGSEGKFYCINEGSIGGDTASCTCTCVSGSKGTNCESPHNVTDMSGLYNAISYQGSNVIPNSHKALLAVKTFRCNESGSDCASSSKMFDLRNFYGSIACANDNADCVLDGESTRQVMYVYGTDAQTLTFRALTFKSGRAFVGGAIYCQGSSTIIDIVFCAFIDCRATSSSNGGGAVYLYSYPTINVYGSRFSGNTAHSGNGGDIYKYYGTITIHDTCPSPYTANIPSQGKARIREGEDTSSMDLNCPKLKLTSPPSPCLLLPPPRIGS